MSNTDQPPFTETHWELCNFIEAYDRFPRSTDFDHAQLYNSLDAFRTLYASGKMDPQEAAQLNHIHGWEWDKRRATFQERVSEFSDYFAEHGEAPSQIHPTEFKLGRWVGSLIASYAKGQVPQWKLSILNCTPGWSWDLRAARFERRVNELKRHYEMFDSLAPKYLSPELRTWVNNRRAEYKDGSLDADKLRWIETIPGWSWGRSKQETA